MTTIPSTTLPATAQNTQTNEDKSPASIGYDAFLQLLIAQLKHQDPTKPVDSTEYVSQLASLSNLEQVIKQNSKLDQILTSADVAQAQQIIGRTVTSSDGEISGIVVAAQITNDGVIATLLDGQTITLGPGVTVSY